MEINIVTEKNETIYSGQGLPIEALFTGRHLIPAGRERCALLQATPDEEPGEEVVIFGNEYIVAKRHYNLSAGYGILATLTPKMTLVPKLRKAVGKETGIIKRKGIPANDYWPIVVSLRQHMLDNKPKFVEEVLEVATMNLTEDSDLTSQEEETEE